MIGRRAMLGAAIAFGASDAAAGSLPVPAGGRLGFRVVRNGSAIGQHLLFFEAQGTQLVVRVEVDIAVTFGPITLYRYRHRARESWEGGQVAAFSAETNDDGTRSTVTMRPQGERLAVESTTAGSYLAPSGALPATHWNRRMLQAPFINTQTGELMRPQVRSAGAEALPWAPQRRGERMVMSGDVDMETWYDAMPGWIGLRFLGRDGSTIQYEIL